MNAVCGPGEQPHAVLLRAAAPLAGLDAMRERRAEGAARPRPVRRARAGSGRRSASTARSTASISSRGPLRIVDDGTPPPDAPGDLDAHRPRRRQGRGRCRTASSSPATRTSAADTTGSGRGSSRRRAPSPRAGGLRGSAGAPCDLVVRDVVAAGRVARSRAPGGRGSRCRRSGARRASGTCTSGIVVGELGRRRQARPRRQPTARRHRAGETAPPVVRVERIGEREQRSERPVVGIDRQVEVRGVGERAVDRHVLEVHGALAPAPPRRRIPRSQPRSASRAARRVVELLLRVRVDAGDTRRLRGAVRVEPRRGRTSTARATAATRSPGSYMSSSGTTENGSRSSATDGSIACSMNTPSPGCAATPTQPSPQPCSTCASAISDPPPLLPNSTTASAPRARTHAAAAATSRAREVVQAVGVVVEVARREAEHREAGGREQRARVVHREVAARVREDDRGVPRLPGGRRPQDAAHERAVVGDDAHRLARRSRRRDRPRRAARSRARTVAAHPGRIGHEPRLACPTRGCLTVAAQRRRQGRARDRRRERHGPRDRRAVRRRGRAGRGATDRNARRARRAIANWPLDVTDPTAIDRVVDEVVDTLGPIDILVNYAGVSLPAPIDGRRLRRRVGR